MKVLAASDLHSDNVKAKRLANRAEAEGVELVLLGGDILDSFHESEGLISPFKEKGIEVLMVHGNHEAPEDIDFLSEKYGEGVYNLHSYYKEFDNVAFLGVGGTEFSPFGLNDDDLVDNIRENLRKLEGKKKVLLTHEPPKGTKLDNLGWVQAGGGRIRSLVEAYKPDMVLCGHIHETFGLTDYINDTKVINTGSDGVILDL